MAQNWKNISKMMTVSMRIRMKELGMTQTALAKKLGCTQQYVSLLLKGEENVTLETICRLEHTLGVKLIEVVKYKKESAPEAYPQETEYQKPEKVVEPAREEPVEEDGDSLISRLLRNRSN